jgi:hypothetical protein
MSDPRTELVLGEGWQHPVDRQLREWKGRWRSLQELPPDETAELAAFVRDNHPTLKLLATERGCGGGYTSAALRARAVLGDSKPKPNGNNPNEDACLLVQGWTPVQGKPGNAWRDCGKLGRFNVFATEGRWQIGRSRPGGLREYWPVQFSSSAAARSAVERFLQKHTATAS